ncbi:hypothetical protein [Paenibacillus andongensis]|uniref:hypothetical protein n=1 Tax=Paenibacillus andongensis TaxID=2975482 RepID=UPI0021BB81AB|nr:hypothetical protein [Paenibacillus andongensis]
MNNNKVLLVIIVFAILAAGGVAISKIQKKDTQTPTNQNEMHSHDGGPMHFD